MRRRRRLAGVKSIRSLEKYARHRGQVLGLVGGRAAKIAATPVSYHSKRPEQKPGAFPPFSARTMPRPDEPPRPESPDPARAVQDAAQAGDARVAGHGETLVALDPGDSGWRSSTSRAPLVDAVLLARGIRAHEGRRRQIQYIGKLMRDIDPAPLQATLDRWAAGAPADHARFAAVERWRDDRLVDATGRADRFVGAYPQADRRRPSRSYATSRSNARAADRRTGIANCFARCSSGNEMEQLINVDGEPR